MNDIENKKWTSKKELAEICNCDVRTIERIIENLTCEGTVAAQLHIKKLVIIIAKCSMMMN